MTHPDDVVCVTKRYCSDVEASQAPVLILPQSFLGRLPTRLPVHQRPDKITAADRRGTWLELAMVLLRQRPLEEAKLARAVRYLQRAGTGQGTPAGALEALPWHEAAKHADLLQGNESLATFALLLPVAAFKVNLRA